MEEDGLSDSESTEKIGCKRPRESDGSDDGFTTVTRRKSKRGERENHGRDNVCEEGRSAEEIYTEVSLFGTHTLPKQMAFARFLRDENIGNVMKIKYKSPYKLIIRFSEKHNAQKLVNLKKLEELNIRAQFTTDSLLSYGIIKGVDLDTSEKELLESLSCDYDIISAKRLRRVNNEGKWVESESVRLCFNNPTAPLYINAYGCRFDVERYEFPVTQCSGCWKFNHVRKFCNLNKSICPKCTEYHDNCEIKEFKCVNCKGPHMALDKSCPFFIKEKEIRQIMSQRNVTYKVGLELFLKNKKEDEKYHDINDAINIEIDRDFIKEVPTNVNRSYSSVLKTKAEIHKNEKRPLVENKVNKSKNKDKTENKYKKTKVNSNNYNSENQNFEMDCDRSEDSDQDTTDPTEKAEKRRKRNFDVWKLLQRIKEIIVCEENVGDKVLLVVKAVFEECKLFLVDFLKEGKLYDILTNIIFNG
ncbi:uncharacterized protein LOC112044065 [Bicyclus anynana]|uniref:Uncharacterized protein LOC112044065 n=1 Tax=Bicyclus anynana TaxID=110368 RepID=A0A6J1MM59_BICAN|nr:uncharacterized protein LOC112044065 [Bicyclus anynana]